MGQEGDILYLNGGIPSFAQGMPILVVDTDAASLVHLACLLEQYSYSVTTIQQAHLALSLIGEQKKKFKLVITDCNMPDMDCLLFLQILTKKDLPVIVMSSDVNLNVSQKALAEGARFFLEKPISMGDLKNIWQHADWKGIMEAQNLAKERMDRGKKTQYRKIEEAGSMARSSLKTYDLHLNNHQQMLTDPKGKNKQVETEVIVIDDDTEPNIAFAETLITARNNDLSRRRKSNDKDGKRKEKRCSIGQLENNSKFMKPPELGWRGRLNNNNSSTEKTSRVSWKTNQIVNFSADNGAADASGKLILDTTNVPGQYQFPSHLQKYQGQVPRISETGPTDLFSVGKPPNSLGISGSTTPFVNQRSVAFQKTLGNNDFGIGGSLSIPDLQVGNFGNNEPRTLNYNSGYAGTYGNLIDNLHCTNNYLEDQMACYGGSNTLNNIKETGNLSKTIDMSEKAKGKQPLELEGSSAYINDMNLLNLDGVTPEIEPPMDLQDAFDFLDAQPSFHPDENLTPYDLFNPLSDDIFQMDFFVDQDPVFASGQTDLTSAPIPDIYFGNEIQMEDAKVEQAPQASSSNPNQPEIHFQLSTTEDPKDIDNIEMKDIDLYCKYLMDDVPGDCNQQNNLI